jgi:hypothetical protein
MPFMENTRPVISEGWTKIEAPMIVPTTMAMAWGNPMACRSPWDSFLFKYFITSPHL